MAIRLMTWEFECGYAATRVAIKSPVHIYSDPLEIVAAFFGYTRLFAEENTDAVHPVTGMTVQEHIDDCLGAGTWGWCAFEGTRRAIHVWYDKQRNYEEVLPNMVATLAHEQGHLFGVYDSDPEREEQRATGYELIAASSLELAKRIMPSGPVWRAKAPDAQGWWWRKPTSKKAHGGARIYKVKEVAGELFVSTTNGLFSVRSPFCTVDSEWSGPIQMPVDGAE